MVRIPRRSINLVIPYVKTGNHLKRATRFSRKLGGWGWDLERGYCRKGWFEKAAAQNHPDAHYSLQLFVVDGRGGPKDKNEAKRYLAGAQLGSEDAVEALHRLNCPFKMKGKDGNEGVRFASMARSLKSSQLPSLTT